MTQPGSTQARMPYFITPKKMQRILFLIRFGYDNMKQMEEEQQKQKTKNIYMDTADDLMEQFGESIEQWF